ncbi:MAG: hypothetical protein EAZ60_04160 [Oscillatoriales cyanobacterium]|nr:MAG: hypothetical protein EAZ83_11860 [Oscillatoriales cyanobacterium]TAF20215.1 MAG: hypothetical protein EAZ73_12710 [Oscillatoriales cyanobacterium]TAF39276.1 MAG: hypothetical protein EAZ69_01520 [Oscillatoriales cyanobacterium]TAF58196.1 MAG: hypothetical protein EAZ60_04160 [Oscillatoriales cyanobacterium]
MYEGAFEDGCNATAIRTLLKLSPDRYVEKMRSSRIISGEGMPKLGTVSLPVYSDREMFKGVENIAITLKFSEFLIKTLCCRQRVPLEVRAERLRVTSSKSKGATAYVEIVVVRLGNIKC